MRRLMHNTPLAVLGVLVVLSAGCGSSAPSSTTHVASAGAPGSGGTVQVVMKNLDFSPTSIDAKVGDRVVWANDDSSPHNVTYVSGPEFKSSRPILRPRTRFSITLTTAGTIHYFCSIHPWMKATIVVSQ